MRIATNERAPVAKHFLLSNFSRIGCRLIGFTSAKKVESITRSFRHGLVAECFMRYHWEDLGRPTSRFQLPQNDSELAVLKPITFSIFSCIFALGLIAATYTLVSIDFFRAWFTKLPFEAPPLKKEWHIVYAGNSNLTRHCISYASSDSSACGIFVIGSFYRGVQWIRSSDGKGKPVIILRSDFFFHSLLKSIRHILEHLPHITRCISIGCSSELLVGLVRALSKVIRGFYYEKCFSLIPQSEVCVFGVTSPETHQLNEYMQALGTFTVHWCHGYISNSLSFDGSCDLALCTCEADANVLREFADYRVTLVLE